jgi:signal peptidase I
MPDPHLSLSPSEGPDNLSPSSANLPKRKHPWLAGLLSLFFPGLGQLYNRQPIKGTLMAMSLSLLGFLVITSKVILIPAGLLAIAVASFGARLFIVGDAIYRARKPSLTVWTRSSSWGAQLVMIVVIVLPTFFPTSQSLLTYFRAFKVPSISMCPTICVGERIVADMEAYKNRTPQRGELVMLRTKFEQPLFIKRVIAIGGDTVKQGTAGEILVNGNPLPTVPTCGKPDMERTAAEPTISFCPVSVPVGSLFVIGDNLDHSLDSRTPAFGLVTQDQIRGRPLYLYWSSQLSRIGCRVH